jgi:hypothetical protein
VLQLQRLIRFYVKYSAFENSYTGLYSLFPSWNQLSLLKAEKTAFDSHSKKMENNLRMGYEKIVENIMRRMNPLHQNLNDDDLLFWAQCLDSWCTSALKAEKARLICIDFLSAIISQIAKKARITDILSARKTQFDSYLLEIYSFSCFQAGTNQLCRQNDLIKLLDHTSRLWSLMHDRWNVLPQLASVSAVWRLSESLEKHGLYQSANLILQLIQKSPLTKQGKRVYYSR